MQAPPVSRLPDEQPRRIDGSVHVNPPAASTCRKCGLVADDLTWLRNPTTNELEIYCFEPLPCYERAETAERAATAGLL